MWSVAIGILLLLYHLLNDLLFSLLESLLHLENYKVIGLYLPSTSVNFRSYPERWKGIFYIFLPWGNKNYVAPFNNVCTFSPSATEKVPAALLLLMCSFKRKKKIRKNNSQVFLSVSSTFLHKIFHVSESKVYIFVSVKKKHQGKWGNRSITHKKMFSQGKLEISLMKPIWYELTPCVQLEEENEGKTWRKEEFFYYFPLHFLHY